MRLRPAFIAVLVTVVPACWLAVHAQQENQPATDPIPVSRIPIEPDEVAAIAAGISQRSEHLKPMFEEVHPSDWVAKGAPEAYISQWNSLAEQNLAIETDMTAIAPQRDATQGAPLELVLNALFRVHRFDSDLNGLLQAVRRYQNPALADLVESVAAGDQRGVEKLQQYALDLAAEKDRQLDVVDKEAQRCRSTLASQPVNHPATPKRAIPEKSK